MPPAGPCEELIARLSSSQIGICADGHRQSRPVGDSLAKPRAANGEEWKLIDRAPKVRMQKGEPGGEFVLNGEADRVFSMQG